MTAPERRKSFRRGIRIGRVAGVDLHADWSLIFIFALIAVNLGAGVFPAWHPEWSLALSWGMALIAATLFFASVALHELSHAIVGRANGVPVNRITLFVFGGMAHMEREPPSARSEFLMAIVGPITSIAIGVVASVAGVWLSALSADTIAATPEQAARAMGPVATLLLWLGPINLLLGAFNLVPGFPLDGGRVLRAGLWWITGDLRRATQWAAATGQGFAWLLMGLGVAMLFGVWVPLLGGGTVQGLWLILIGWFLGNAARASFHQLLVRQALEDVAVSQLMRPSPQSVEPQVTVEELVRDYIMATDQHAFPVVRDAALVGMVHMDDVRRAPRQRWSSLRVSDIMTPTDRLDTVTPDEDAMTAFRQLADHDQVPVVDNGRVVGMANRRDFIKWLAFHNGAPH